MITAIEKHSASATSDSKSAEQFRLKILESVKKRKPFYLSQGFTKKDFDELHNEACKLFTEKKYEEAKKAFQIMVAYDCTDRRAWMGVATVEEVLQNYDHAIMGYKSASKLTPNLPEALEPLIYLCRCYRLLRKKEEAIETLQKINILIEKINGLKNNSMIENMLQAVIEKKSFYLTQGLTQDHIEAFDITTKYFYSEGKVKEENSMFQLMAVYDHLDRRAWLGAADSFQRLHRDALAATAYIIASLLNHEDPTPLFFAAYCYLRLGDYRRALKTFEKTIVIAKQDLKYDSIKKEAEKQKEKLATISWNSVYFKKYLQKEDINDELIPKQEFAMAKTMFILTLDGTLRYQTESLKFNDIIDLLSITKLSNKNEEEHFRLSVMLKDEGLIQNY